MMRFRGRSAIGGVLFAIGLAPAARAQDAALLLGQRETTILIVVHADTVTARRGAGLIVPRATGWWRVGVDGPSIAYPELRARLYPRWRADSIRADSVQRSAMEPPETMPPTPVATEPEEQPREMNMHGEELGHEACFAHVVWAAPLGTMPTLPDDDCAEGADPSGEYSFTFVSPAILTMYAGITTDYSYNFTRGTIVATLDSAARHPLTSIGGRSYEEDAVDPNPVLGVAPNDPAWAREARRCNLEYNRGIREDNDDTTSWDYRGSWIARTPGRWRYSRYYANTSYVGRGMESNCVVRVPVPARLTGWDRLTLPMSAIRKRVPKALDAFTSPNGAIAMVLDSTAARVFRVEKGTLGRELASIPADPTLVPAVENTVMAQWATGAPVRRWEAELAAVLPEVLTVMPGGVGASKR